MLGYLFKDVDNVWAADSCVFGSDHSQRQIRCHWSVQAATPRCTQRLPRNARGSRHACSSMYMHVYTYVFTINTSKKLFQISFIYFFLSTRRNLLLLATCFKVWDDQLSSEAANWIKSCKFEHQMKGRGENLAFDTNPRKDEELINSSMKAWYDEIKDYNYARKQCGRSCHYTQVHIYKRLYILIFSFAA